MKDFNPGIMTSESPLPSTVPPSLYWIKLQFIKESKHYYYILCIEKLHSAIEHILFVILWKVLQDLQGNTPLEVTYTHFWVCSQRRRLWASDSALARQWISWSQLPPHCLFQCQWALSGSQMTEREQVIGGHLLC